MVVSRHVLSGGDGELMNGNCGQRCGKISWRVKYGHHEPAVAFVTLNYHA